MDFAGEVLWRVTPPLEAKEEGRDLFDRDCGASAERDASPPLALRERPDEGECDSLPVPDLELRSNSSGSTSDSLPGLRIDSDLPRLALEGREAIGVSGTACPEPSGGIGGGGLSGPSAPPMLGTPGSRRRISSTSSSAASRNWTNWHCGQMSVPNRSSTGRVLVLRHRDASWVEEIQRATTI